MRTDPGGDRTWPGLQAWKEKLLQVLRKLLGAGVLAGGPSSQGGCPKSRPYGCWRGKPRCFSRGWAGPRGQVGAGRVHRELSCWRGGCRRLQKRGCGSREGSRRRAWPLAPPHSQRPGPCTSTSRSRPRPEPVSGLPHVVSSPDSRCPGCVTPSRLQALSRPQTRLMCGRRGWNSPGHVYSRVTSPFP